MKLKCSERKSNFLRALRISYWFGAKIEFSHTFCSKMVIFGDFSTLDARTAALARLATPTTIFFLIAGVCRAFR